MQQKQNKYFQINLIFRLTKKSLQENVTYYEDKGFQLIKSYIRKVKLQK